MMAWTGVAKPEPRELRACALAALAEAGVLALPVWLVLTETRGIRIGVVALAVPLAVAYVGGAVVACLFRASRNVAGGAAILAAVAGVWLGHGDPNRTAFAIVVCLLVAFRMVTLALRDWRVPIHAEFGWFALALGLEVMIAADATPEWRGPLTVIVPVFFVAALASRASTVWTSGGAGELDERVRSSWIRRALLGTFAMLGAMGAAVAFSIENGVFERVGAWLSPVANAVASFVAWALSQAARPIFWLVDRLGIDPDRVREFLENLGDSSARPSVGEAGGGEPSIWQRGLGLLVFAGIGYAVYRAIRHFRPPAAAEPEPRPSPAASGSAIAQEAERPVKPRFRREPPADTVRRWYAETLWALRRKDVVREPWQTPAEFAPVVATALPACAREFAELTHAYEDVRYGSLRVDAEALVRLEASHKRIIGALEVR